MKLFKLDPNGEPRLWVCVVVDTVDGWQYESVQGETLHSAVVEECWGGGGCRGERET